MRISRQIVTMVAAIFILTAWTNVFSQKGRHDQPLTDELTKILADRTKLVFDAFRTSDGADWAGLYFQGDHHPTELSWEPETGFVVTASRHTFSPSWINYGEVRFEHDRLELFPAMPRDSPYAFNLKTEYVGIRWGDWRFLVPPDELMSFAYAVHSGSSFEIWQYFVRPGVAGGRDKKLPEMEDVYLKIIKSSPIRPKVIAVRQYSEHILSTEVTLNSGRNKGLIEGMTFYYSDGRDREFISIRVDVVEEKTATAVVSSWGGTRNDLEGPKPGMIFSSKMPAGFIEPG